MGLQVVVQDGVVPRLPASGEGIQGIGREQVSRKMLNPGGKARGSGVTSTMTSRPYL